MLVPKYENKFLKDAKVSVSFTYILVEGSSFA